MLRNLKNIMALELLRDSLTIYEIHGNGSEFILQDHEKMDPTKYRYGVASNDGWLILTDIIPEK